MPPMMIPFTFLATLKNYVSTDAFLAGGQKTNVAKKDIYATNFATTGTLSDIGDLINVRTYGVSGSSTTLAVILSHSQNTVLGTESFTYATKAKTDYGPTLTESYRARSGGGNSTRLIFGGYRDRSAVQSSALQYTTMGTTGTFTAFGNLATYKSLSGNVSSQTRLVFGGGDPSFEQYSAAMDYVTIATTGNATAFGSLTIARNTLRGGMSNGTRGIFSSGNATDTNGADCYDYITIATTGNATDFGNAPTGFLYESVSVSDKIRGLSFQGSGIINTLLIATIGNSTNFGSMTTVDAGPVMFTGVHGGTP